MKLIPCYFCQGFRDRIKQTACVKDIETEVYICDKCFIKKRGEIMAYGKKAHENTVREYNRIIPALYSVGKYPFNLISGRINGFSKWTKADGQDMFTIEYTTCAPVSNNTDTGYAYGVFKSMGRTGKGGYSEWSRVVSYIKGYVKEEMENQNTPLKYNGKKVSSLTEEVKGKIKAALLSNDNKGIFKHMAIYFQVCSCSCNDEGWANLEVTVGHSMDDINSDPEVLSMAAEVYKHFNVDMFHVPFVLLEESKVNEMCSSYLSYIEKNASEGKEIVPYDGYEMFDRTVDGRKKYVSYFDEQIPF